MSSNSKFKLEYVWLDGYLPEPNLRSKTKIVSKEPGSVADLPMWGFDGSSTQQAEGKSSDCLLKPVALYPDTTRKNGYLVMCEVLLPDGTPHPSNFRATVGESEDLWIGLEQEYFIYENGRPLGFPADGYPAQGPYYTGVGYKNVGDVARQLVEEHGHHVGRWHQLGRNQRAKLPRVSGSSKFSPLVRRRSVTTCGWLAICSCAWLNRTAWTLNGIASQFVATGTDPVCTAISRPSTCEKLVAKLTSTSSWPLSRRTATSTSLLMVQTTTCV